jgi:predicted Zn-ribbon and HTH transcriptional regulator
MDSLKLDEIGRRLDQADAPIHIVECQNCGWTGDEGELLVWEDSFNEVVYCPECNSDNLEDW